MDWNTILPIMYEALGGGGSAVAILVLLWELRNRGKRVDILTDRLFEMSRMNITAMNELQKQIEMALKGRG